MRIILLALLASLAIAAPAAAQASQEALFAAIGVRPGATVCEIGAGNGALSIAAAKVVGASGRVFTSELGERRVATLRERVGASGVEHITVVAGEPTSTNFPERGCDALFLRDVYHHFTEPAAMNRSIAASLKPGGRAGIIDFMPPPGSSAPTASDRGRDGSHGVRPDEVTAEMSAEGFEVVHSDTGQRWFMLVFALKP
jgi:ubiquinone/menaquinone biosynthesis C-methylase UbiE